MEVVRGEMDAEVATRLEDPQQPFGVGDVVENEVGCAHNKRQTVGSVAGTSGTNRPRPKWQEWQEWPRGRVMLTGCSKFR